MKWIRAEKRLAIYLRDGMACCYCGSGERLTLDHLKPSSAGGSNAASNLVTCCRRCNSSRSNRSWREFAAVAAERAGVTAGEIIRRVERSRRRRIDTRAAAEKILSKREHSPSAEEKFTLPIDACTVCGIQ